MGELRKRSDVVRKRSEVSKPSAEERTEKLPRGLNGAIECTACNEKINVDRVKLREKDGMGECPECGAELDTKNAAIVAKNQTPPPVTATDTPVIDYCGECGREWPRVSGKLFRACGHEEAIRVNHPSKAANLAKAPAGLQTRQEKAMAESPTPETKAPENRSSAQQSSLPNEPMIQFDGDRLMVTWGASKFSGQDFGASQYGNFEVGQQFVSTTLPPGANRVAVAMQILAEMREIADHAFTMQKAWYLSKIQGSRG